MDKNSDFNSQIKSLSSKMKKGMDKKRYQHTLGVAVTASCMAMRFNEDPYKAYLAGLLHDNAKCISSDQKISICGKNGIKINKTEMKNPDLLHAKAGSILAKKEYGITDEDILNAIMYHTTGRPGMSALEKIIYIADYIEIGRKKLPNMEEIRVLAFSDLDQCMYSILKNVIDYLTEKESTIDEITIQTFDFYKEVISEHE